MPAPLLLIETTQTLPPAADVVVIGGGIVGACTAYYLARRGVKVALVEKGRIGAEQSSRNWGWCRQQNRDARELPMATASLALWERHGRRDRRETSASAAAGLLYLSERRGRDRRLGPLAGLRPHPVGVVTHMLSAAEATERGRATGKPWKGGVFSPTDGMADPDTRRPGRRPRRDALGGSVHQSCAARGLELEAGRVGGVVTEAGTIRTRTVVLAGGAWASSFCRQLGIRFPQAAVRSSILAVGAGRGRTADALHTSAHLADPARRTAAIPSPSAAAPGSIRRRSSSASPASSCRCSPDAGARSPRAASRPGARATRRCARWRARPADADGAHPHPRSRPDAGDDPRNPSPGRASCCPASQTSRSPPHGRATSTAPRTACPRSARPRSRA